MMSPTVSGRSLSLRYGESASVKAESAVPSYAARSDAKGSSSARSASGSSCSGATMTSWPSARPTLAREVADMRTSPADRPVFCTTTTHVVRRCFRPRSVTCPPSSTSIAAASAALISTSDGSLLVPAVTMRRIRVKGALSSAAWSLPASFAPPRSLPVIRLPTPTLPTADRDSRSARAAPSPCTTGAPLLALATPTYAAPSSDNRRHDRCCRRLRGPICPRPLLTSIRSRKQKQNKNVSSGEIARAAATR